VACRRGFFLPVRVLSCLFRRRFLEELAKAHGNGQLHFFAEYTALAEASTFSKWLAALRSRACLCKLKTNTQFESGRNWALSRYQLPLAQINKT
jgi:hypothetical protein